MSSARIATNLVRSALMVAVSFLILTTPLDSQAQKYSVLHSFAGGQDGNYPYTSLILDAQGNLYGTTEGGGAYGGGTVFKVDASAHETILYSFNPSAYSGYGPFGDLVHDPAGNLFGPLMCAGFCDQGESPGGIFELTPSGTESVYMGTSGKPVGDLLRDAQGNLYGDSGISGPYLGEIFEVTAADQYKQLFVFTGGTDGGYPGGLVRDAKGNLYGATASGGTSSFCTDGCGTIYELSAAGIKKVLYSFCSLPGCPDGFGPGGLIRDAHGNLYGTTPASGIKSKSCGGYGCGTVFELTSAGKFKTLHRFKGSPNDGQNPFSLTLDASGNLYGTALYGGNGKTWYQGETGSGAVFKITPAGTEMILYSFSGGTDGALPSGPLLLDTRGNLYGTTSAGGANYGVVYKIIP